MIEYHKNNNDRRLEYLAINNDMIQSKRRIYRKTIVRSDISILKERIRCLQLIWHIKTNAVVVYITQNTKNNVSLNITGATVNTCVGLQNILDAIKKGHDV